MPSIDELDTDGAEDDLHSFMLFQAFLALSQIDVDSSFPFEPALLFD